MQGSPSPSGRLANEEALLIWTKEHSQQGGFPSTAEVVMLPGLANFTILELLADQTSDLLYTEPIRFLIDAMRQNGIERIFYAQCLWFLSLICFYTFFAIGAVSQPPPDPELEHDCLTMFSLDHASLHPVLWTGAACGFMSCVLSIYFLWREAHELYGHSAYDEERSEAEHSKILSGLGVDPAVGQSPNIFSAWSGAAGESCANQNTLDSGKNGIGRVNMHKRHSNCSVASEKTTVLKCSTSTDDHSTVNKHSDEANPIASIVRAISWKNKLKSKVAVQPVPFMSGSFRRNLSGQIEAGGRRHWFPSKREFLAIFKRLRLVLSRTLHIDLSYFLHIWNFLGLVSFLLVLASYVRFVITWRVCARLSADIHAHGYSSVNNTSAGGSNVSSLSLQSDGAEIGAPYDNKCSAELAKLRVLTSLAIPVLYMYSLYYVRCVDKVIMCQDHVNVHVHGICPHTPTISCS